MILSQLPALQVTLPLIAAPLCLLLRSGRAAWLLCLIVSTIALGIALRLLEEVWENGLIVYSFGGWAAPWGIEYRVDLANAFVLMVVAGISTAVLLFARTSAASEIDEDRHSLFYTAWLLCLTGLLGMAITGDAFNLFVFLEISSLSSYVLIAMSRDRRALTASYQYLIMGTIGATFILIAVGMLYMVTGTLNMADLAGRIPDLFDNRTLRTAFAFLTVGMGIKLAMFPLHLWLPNAYTYAPSAVTAFLAATATKVAVYALVRFMFSVFGTAFAFESMPLQLILVVLGTAAVLSGSTIAIFQHNVKRMLAYSSVAQIGYLMLGLSLATAAGLTATLVHLFNHALMKGGLFLALGCMAYRLGNTRLADLAGMGFRMPWTVAAFVIGGLSLIGLPLTAGFISKWVLVQAVLEIGWWPLVVVVVAGALLAVVYIWRVVEAAYFRTATESDGGSLEAPLGLLIPTWLLIGANIYFGIQTDLSLSVARLAADVLTGGHP